MDKTLILEGLTKMGLRRIGKELEKQMAERNLRFNIENDLELEEVKAESSEYIQENYNGTDAEKVAEYLKETVENYPEHIEPIREYIEPIKSLTGQPVIYRAR